MKATFPRQTLMSGLGLTQNAVAGSSSLPILANVLFDAQADGVNLIATDLESFARVRLEAHVEEAGRITVPAKTLAEIVRLLPDDDIAMVSSGSRMTLTCNRNVYHLATMSADDFPQWPGIEAQCEMTLKQSDLKNLLHNTLFAMPTRDPRKVLMGVLFEAGPEQIVCVATDGRKLGKSVTKPVEFKGEGSITAIIPGRVLNEINHALSDDGEIGLALSDQRAVFTIESLNLTYLTSLIEGRYPQYDAVIPASFKKTLNLSKNVLAEAIGRAAILAERKHNSIVLNFEKGSIQIRAQSFDDGSYEGEVDLDYSDEPFKIAFNYQYLSDVFRIAPDATIQMKVKDSSSPVVFECESNPNSLYLVMPVRIHDLEGGNGDPEDDESAQE